MVDKYESASERTSGKPIALESVYAILPGSDPKLAKTLFIVSGHFDSRPSNVMDPEADAPGADDDASGVSVSVESARLLGKLAATEKGGYRATLLFAAISGEEQGLFGGYRLLEWAKQQGYTIGGMLDDDIVGADPTTGAPHRVRLFSGNGEIDDCDSPGRELARAIEEIDGRENIRMIFRVDRYGRGGDHYPFYKAGLPAVRFTEPLEDYAHQHQTPRTENGVEYADFAKYLNLSFLGDVARDNAEALRQLAIMAPAPHQQTRSSLALSRPTPKYPGRPKMIPNAPASRFSGAKQPTPAGRSTTLRHPRAKRYCTAFLRTIISSPFAPSAKMAPAPSPCPRKWSAARRRCRQERNNSDFGVRRS